MPSKDANVDPRVVEDFGQEWHAFDQSALAEADLEAAFRQYFAIFPFDRLPADASGFDMGCGSGRWAKFVAPRVGRLRCIEPSAAALDVARCNLRGHANVEFECASVDTTSLATASQDFGYSLGVLHHVPDTAAGISSCARLLKPGAPFLLYLYYDFENRPGWFRALWRLSDRLRRAISRQPFDRKRRLTTLIAYVVYLPLARLAWLAERLGLDVAAFPLADYRNKPLYFMKTDALDRFGTKLEQRFSRAEIAAMLADAGFRDVTFSTEPPFWVCVAYRR